MRGFAGRLRLKVKTAQSLKGHTSELQMVNEAVPNVCVVLALDFSTNIMVTLSEKAA